MSDRAWACLSGLLGGAATALTAVTILFRLLRHEEIE